MRSTLESAGVGMHIESDLDWVDELITEGAAGQLGPSAPPSRAPLLLRISRRSAVLEARLGDRHQGVWRHGSETIFEDVCATEVSPAPEIAEGGGVHIPVAADGQEPGDQVALRFASTCSRGLR
jgi:hypothetical protein